MWSFGPLLAAEPLWHLRQLRWLRLRQSRQGRQAGASELGAEPLSG